LVDNELLTQIIENTNDVVIVTRAGLLDEPGPVIEYVNAAFTRLTGYLPEEVIGKSPRILQGPGTDAATRRRIRDALRRGEPVREEILNYAKDGQEYWLDLQIIPLRGPKGELTHFAAIERDLTERHQAEQAQRESEQLFRSVISSMVEGVVVQDADGFIIASNIAAERILGLNADQMAGRTSIDPRWSAIHPDGSPFPGNEHPSMQTLRTGAAYRDVIMGVQKADDSLTWISINTSPVVLRSSDGPDAVVSTFHDVTEQRRAEELKAEFVSTVSHELRTPLTSINGVIRLLGRGGLAPLPDSARELVNVAERNCDRLNTLINDLLDMEKIAAGKIAFELTSQDLVALIEGAVSANQPYAERHQVRFVFDHPGAGIHVQADANRIIQVLTNFLSNAAKFSPEDGAIAIAVDTEDPGWVRVTVADQGSGIPESFRGRVFEAFTQSEAVDTRKHGGTGLGLAISKALIEKHHGRIGFYDNDPRGTVFYFDLPMAAT
jgi:PAS domain S-box-containing protein